MPRPTKLPAIAKLAVEALEDLKGVDIKVLDVKKLTPITDVMIICTGTSNRHVKSLAGSVIEKSKHSGHMPSGVEGMEMGEWVLVNLGEVIVHVMQLQSRAFYQLEKLWDLQPPEEDFAIPKPPKQGGAKKKTAAKGKGGAKAGAKRAAPRKAGGSSARKTTGGSRKRK